MRIPQLTLRGITARPVVLKLKRPVVARIATITEWPVILIDLLTEEGVVGRSYLEPYVVKSMRYLVPALDDLGSTLKGQQVAPVELFLASRKSLHFVGYEGLSMIAASGLDMAYLALSIRHLWRGPDLSVPGVSDPELYTYTLAMLLISAATLMVAFWRRSLWLRKIAMAGIGLTIAKVFLVDMAGLSGLIRVLSFMGLGLALLGLTWLNRVMSAHWADAEEPADDPVE